MADKSPEKTTAAIHVDLALDARVEKALPDHFGGTHKRSLRVAEIMTQWLKSAPAAKDDDNETP